MKPVLLYTALALGAGLAGAWLVANSAEKAGVSAVDNTEIAALQAHVTRLEQQQHVPELGQQMLELQIRHDRLWWAGEAGNWNLAYFMVGELGEALRGIEQANGEAPELQPEKLADIMPELMNPTIRAVQEALAKKDKAGFAKAYDQLSAACTECHVKAGVDFLHIQRPLTPLLDNLRYDPSPVQ